MHSSSSDRRTTTTVKLFFALAYFWRRCSRSFFDISVWQGFTTMRWTRTRQAEQTAAAKAATRLPFAFRVVCSCDWFAALRPGESPSVPPPSAQSSALSVNADRSKSPSYSPQTKHVRISGCSRTWGVPTRTDSTETTRTANLMSPLSVISSASNPRSFNAAMNLLL